MAVKMVRSGQIQDAFWRERQQIDFKREELNTNCNKAIQKVTIGSYNWEKQSGADLGENWNQKPEDPSLSSSLPASNWVSGSFSEATISRKLDQAVGSCPYSWRTRVPFLNSSLAIPGKGLQLS